jgi:ATP adenylyltransferase
MSEVIWAPWRMEFILGEKTPGCVLCNYVGVAPGTGTLVLAQRPLAYVVLNKYPYTAGHIMVVPKRHVSELTELNGDESAALWSLVQASAARLRQATGCAGMNLGMNLGRVAGAGIHEHIHVHLVPRWEGDHNFISVIGDARVMPEYLEQSRQRLEQAFAELHEEVAL